MTVRVSLTERVSIEAAGVVVDEARFPGRQGRLVFAYLLAAQGRPVPRDELADALWGDHPPTRWEKALSVLVSKLRALLNECGVDGASSLTSAFGCYELTLPAGAWIDVEAAADAVARAELALENGDLDDARAQAATAAKLARRSFLPGEDGSWVEQQRRDLRDILVRALECLGDAALRAEDFAEAVRYAAGVSELEPFRESSYRRLMQAHTAAGNPAEALRVYEHCRRFLAQELGAYPSPETESVYRELLSLRSAEPDRAKRHVAPLATPDAEREAEASPPASRETRPVPHRRRIWLLAAPAVTAAVLLGAAVVAMATSSDEDVTPLATIAPNSVAVIDPESNVAVAQISIGGRPAGVATGFGAVWVGNSQRRTLVRIDAKARRPVATIGLPVTPSSVAVGADAVWVASRDENAVVRVDPTFNSVMRRIAVSHPVDLAVGPKDVWVAQGHDLVSRISTRTMVVTAKVRAGSASGIVVGPGAVWSLSGWSAPANAVGASERLALGSLFRIEPATNDVGRPVPLPELGRVSQPNGITIADDFLWVIKPDGSVFKVAANSGRLEDTGRVGESSATAPSLRTLRPIDIAAGEAAVWVVNTAGTVTRIDPATARAVKQIPLGRYPRRAYPEEVAAGEGAVWVLMH